MAAYFITGIGTGVGKTLISAIITEALEADYWKPVQTGDDTDAGQIANLLSNEKSKIYNESYKLKLPASPHIAAEEEGIEISLERILDEKPITKNTLIIEGAGGVLVPLNKKEFIIDLIKKLDATVIIVSKNYLGSINHSLLTANILKQQRVKVLGWIFNDVFLDYEEEIVNWSGFPWIASVREIPQINKGSIHVQATKMKEHLNLFI